jgi:hypothetical protein
MESANAIEVRGLVKGYKGVPVLHDVSFHPRTPVRPIDNPGLTLARATT